MYALVAWPTKLVHYHGASLHDHETRDKWNQLQEACANPPSSKSTRPYTSAIRNPPRHGPAKYKELLSEESINLVSSKVCCMKNCVQPFPREKIKSFREQMYNQSTFKFRAHMKTEVHRAVHRDARGRRMVTVEGISVHGCIFPGSHRQRSTDIKDMRELIGRPTSMAIRDWQSQGCTLNRQRQR